MQADPHEWHNRAGDPQARETIAELARWLPQVNIPPVPGSAQRILVQENGVWVWEGEPINPAEKIE
jgi:hypothetical protein